MSEIKDVELGQEIHGYRLLALLGAGGMGQVFKAQHTQTGKLAAIKVLRESLKSNPTVLRRFFQEAIAVNEIHHKNVIEILDFGATSDGRSFLLLELLEGTSLANEVTPDSPSMEPKRVAHIGIQICAALAAAHAKGIIHRDIKPDNIFLIEKYGVRDYVKVLDFGIARMTNVAPGEAATKTGSTLGTPVCMSPEQALGRKIDHRSDIYAVGVLLYQMVTGVPPFFARNSVALAMQHVEKVPVPPKERQPEILDELNQVILRCLEKEASARYASMIELAIALGAACGVDPALYFDFPPKTNLRLALQEQIRGAKETEKNSNPSLQEPKRESAKTKSGWRKWFGWGTALLTISAGFIYFC